MTVAVRADLEISPWYLAPCGITDHAFTTCPALQREIKKMQREWREVKLRVNSWGLAYDVMYPEICEGVLSLDPALEMCGWCRRVWLARHRKAAS